MFRTVPLAYSYDGSFEGLLCCVFESYTWKETPLAIHSAEEGQALLLESKWIETDAGKAERVARSLPLRMGREAEELIRYGFWTCAPDKDLLLLKFIQLGFAHGPRVMDRLADDTVDALPKAFQYFRRESHHYLGFIRFSVYGPVMAALIEPRNQVLPVIREHFCDRFRGERFMIYDATHRMALVHEPGRTALVPLQEWTPPEPDETEERYRRLWSRFYEAIGIRERRNDRRRASNMPKRFWAQLPEMRAGKVRSSLRRPGDAAVAPRSADLPAPIGKDIVNIPEPGGNEPMNQTMKVVPSETGR